MTDGIEAVTTAALGLALDAASLRQQAIAANIAQADVEGYVPMTVDFEDQLQEAWRESNGRRQLDPSALSGVAARLRPDTAAAMPGLSPKVLLDLQVARMAQNGVHYQALVAGLTKHFAILSTAVSDGRK
jgi:flagellar basal-body rod protein FlgB